MKRLLSQLIPFIVIGIIIVTFAFGIILLAYLFLFGAIIGSILFLISWIRHKLFPPKTLTPTQKKSGRIIDTNDWKEL